MIALYDSGLGGISILNHFHKKLAKYKYVYYGDTLNSPYGNKTDEEIYQLTKRVVDFLLSKGVVLLIIACNTVSAKALRRLQDGYLKTNYPEAKVLGVIIPNVENVLKTLPKNASLGIIGTRHTIKSHKYETEIFKKRDDIKIYSKSCPKFAQNIEQNKFRTLVFLANIKEELSYFNNLNITYLLLACTHYSFIKKEIKEVVKSNVELIDSSELIANKTIEYLKEHNNLQIKKEPITVFYVSGNKFAFVKNTEKLLQKYNNRRFKFLKAPVFTDN